MVEVQTTGTVAKTAETKKEEPAEPVMKAKTTEEKLVVESTVEKAPKAAEKPVPKETKKETPKKTAAKKTTTAKKDTIEKKTTEKKATVKKTIEKKARTKKATAKKEVSATVVLQYAGKEISASDLMTRAKMDWSASGHKEDDLKEITLYIKPEENAAYYVANGFDTGSIDI
ncbi:MAG TPA: hypothetical protein IAC62_00870 [Candidatus Pelethocola excrementipullorum]|nr:hypothetical protein [Candidatus Pelethocola excrementipullorum]